MPLWKIDRTSANQASLFAFALRYLCINFNLMRNKTIVLFSGIAVVLLLLCALFPDKDDFVPFEKALAIYMNSTRFNTCRDNNFNTEIKVPSGFIKEADTGAVAYSYLRYAYYPSVAYIDADGQITIEYSASVCTDAEYKNANISTSGNRGSSRLHSERDFNDTVPHFDLSDCKLDSLTLSDGYTIITVR